ncbi:MAG: hypothetical protein PHU31_02995 [Anaerotignum sp.]|nr:hypothetical protein [Anaerotignum sp.]
MKLGPGLSFSWKRALGITRAKQNFARQTGMPTTQGGMERKVGKMILRMFGMK